MKIAEESFKDYVLDQLRDMPNISAQRMFSGFGLYRVKKFFGIVSKGVLYFKTNQDTAHSYKKFGMKPFAPSKKQILKNYFEVPAEVLENASELCVWAEKAIGS